MMKASWSKKNQASDPVLNPVHFILSDRVICRDAVLNPVHFILSDRVICRDPVLNPVHFILSDREICRLQTSSLGRPYYLLC